MSENEPTDKQVETPRWRLLAWGSGIAAMSVLTTLGIVWFIPAADWKPESCPRQQDATGVTSPANNGIDSQLEDAFTVIDQGLSGYRDDTFGSTDEEVSFGILVKNESDYVLHNVSVQIDLVDDKGDSVLENLDSVAKEDNSSILDDTRLPVVFPGQEVGFGGSIDTWSKYGEDPETGEILETDPPDYEELELKATAVNGELWKTKNDRHLFTQMPAQKGTVVDTSEADGEYINGDTANLNDIEYPVESPACGDLQAYAPTMLIYNADNDIVGGMTDTANDRPSSHIYGPGTTEMNPPVMGLLAPEDDLSVKVYPYAAPVQPPVIQE